MNFPYRLKNKKESISQDASHEFFLNDPENAISHGNVIINLLLYFIFLPNITSTCRNATGIKLTSYIFIEKGTLNCLMKLYWINGCGGLEWRVGHYGGR